MIAAFWSLHNFKLGQQRDDREGDWQLTEALPKEKLALEESKRLFFTAMNDWDAELADIAIVNLLRHFRPPAVFEFIWPYATRTFLDFGHKIVYASQVERVLQRMDWAHAVPAMRALVNGMTYRGKGDVETKEYDRALELIGKIPDTWLQGRNDNAEVPSILDDLRKCDSNESQELVVTALRTGLGPEPIWTALRLFASEILLQRPDSAARRHLPVHPVTEVNAFGYAWRRTQDEKTKRILILQAAGWLPLWKPVFVEQYQSPVKELVIGDLGKDVRRTSDRVEQVIGRRDPNDVRNFVDAAPRNPQNLFDGLRSELLKRAFQDHQYKYLAAVIEESKLVDADWASQILAPAITYLPTPRDETSEVSRRATFAIKKAGKG